MKRNKRGYEYCDDEEMYIDDQSCKNCRNPQYPMKLPTPIANTITTTYRDSILESKGARPVSAFCKDYGWSVRKMNKWLGDHRMQYKYADKGSWIPSYELEEDGFVIMESGEYYVGNGYVELSCKNYWTPKGRLMIHDKLAEEGIYPIVDKEKGAALCENTL